MNRSIANSAHNFVWARDRRYYRYRIDIVRLVGLSLSIGIDIAHPWVSVSISISIFLIPRSQSQYRCRIFTSLDLSLSLSIEICTSLSLSLSQSCFEIFDTFRSLVGARLKALDIRNMLLMLLFLHPLHTIALYI